MAKKILSASKWALMALAALAALYIYDSGTGQKAASMTVDNFMLVFQILPPLLVLVGLMDVWIPREMLVKHMGPGSGPKGFIIAFFLGSVAAGPLILAFPIAALLAKKGARYGTIIFFMGVWTTTKLPILAMELSFMGVAFTISHIATSLSIYLMGALLMEKYLGAEGTKTLSANT